jgi:hypothetical protein
MMLPTGSWIGSGGRLVDEATFAETDEGAAWASARPHKRAAARRARAAMRAWGMARLPAAGGRESLKFFNKR